jgi:hypothetical protein
MNFKETSVFILLILIGFGCNKNALEQDPQTIYPQEYLPTYPGSEWRYMKSTGDTIIMRTEDDYVLHHFEDGNVRQSIDAYVPVWDGLAVYGYSASRNNQQPRAVLSTVLGETWHTGSSGNHIYTTGKNVALDSTITVNGVDYSNSIVIEYYENNPFGVHVTGYDCYSKNIGLIKRVDYIWYLSPAPPPTVWELIDYNINN